MNELLHPINLIKGDTVNEYLYCYADDLETPFDFDDPANISSVEMWIYRDRKDNTNPFFVLTSNNFEYPENPTEGDYIFVHNVNKVYKYESAAWTQINATISNDAPEDPVDEDYWYNFNTKLLFKYVTDTWVDQGAVNIDSSDNSLFYLSDALIGESENTVRNILNIKISKDVTSDWTQLVYYFNLKFYLNNDTERYTYVLGVINLRHTA